MVKPLFSVFPFFDFLCYSLSIKKKSADRIKDREVKIYEDDSCKNGRVPERILR